MDDEKQLVHPEDDLSSDEDEIKTLDAPKSLPYATAKEQPSTSRSQVFFGSGITQTNNNDVPPLLSLEPEPAYVSICCQHTFVTTLRRA